MARRNMQAWQARSRGRARGAAGGLRGATGRARDEVWRRSAGPRTGTACRPRIRTAYWGGKIRPTNPAD